MARTKRIRTHYTNDEEWDKLPTRELVLGILERDLEECRQEESRLTFFLTKTAVAKKKKQLSGMIKVLQQWNSKRFMSLLQNHAFTSWEARIKERYFVDVLILGCTDALTITETLVKVCEYGCVKSGSIMAPFDMYSPDYFRFFNSYLKKLPARSPRVNKALLDVDILKQAIIYCNTKKIKCALEIEWPSTLLPFTYPMNAEESFGFWPLRKDGVNRDSFNSVDYYKTFTCVIVYAAAVYRRYDYKHFNDCLLLLWRSIPTPCLPIEDMRTYIEYPFGLTLGAPIEDSVNHEPWRTAMENARDSPDVWSRISECLSEVNGDYKPRSLRHLSRCAIRRRCRSSEEIELLPLPNILKKYVDLEF